jgi:hypothetical protein
MGIDMQDVVFELLSDQPGQLVAAARQQHLQISATNLEELQHEAREALISHFGPSHVAYRVRLRRPVRHGLQAGVAQFARGCAPAARSLKRC